MMTKEYAEKIRKFNEDREFTLIKAKDLVEFDTPMLDPLYKLDLMEEEISDNGVMSPLTVAKRENGKYLVIDGARRLKAFKSLVGEDEEIPCYIVRDVDAPMRELRLLSLAANRVKRPDSQEVCIRFTEELLKLHAKGIFSKADLPAAYAQVTGHSERQGRKYISIVEHGSKGLIDKVRTGEVPVNLASNIASRPKKDQTKIAKEYAKLPHGEKKHYLKAVKASAHPTATAAHKAKVKEEIAHANDALKFLLSEEKLDKKDIEFLLSLCSAFVLKYGK